MTKANGNGLKEEKIRRGGGGRLGVKVSIPGRGGRRPRPGPPPPPSPSRRSGGPRRAGAGAASVSGGGGTSISSGPSSGVPVPPPALIAFALPSMRAGAGPRLEIGQGSPGLGEVKEKPQNVSLHPQHTYFFPLLVKLSAARTTKQVWPRSLCSI